MLEHGAFRTPDYAPGSSDWWLCGLVLILLLQMQIRIGVVSEIATDSKIRSLLAR